MSDEPNKPPVGAHLAGLRGEQTDEQIAPLGLPVLPPGPPPGFEPVFTYLPPTMTLRDWFAGLALQGVLTADPAGTLDEDQVHGENRAWVAAGAYRIADAMLEARKGAE